MQRRVLRCCLHADAFTPLLTSLSSSLRRFCKTQTSTTA
jgi:hypothetical protein